MHNRRIMHIMQVSSRCWAMLFFLGALQLSAQDRPVELGPATIGEHYEHALKTSRPARFVRVSVNAAWLTVTAEGVLTGTPGADAPALSQITVDASPLDAVGNPEVGGETLRRTFLVPVRMIACAPNSQDEFAWCDESGTPPKVKVAESAAGSAADSGQENKPAPAAAPNWKKPPRISFTSQSPSIPAQKKGLNGVVAVQALTSGACSEDVRHTDGCIVEFDRLRNGRGEFGHFDRASHTIDWDHELFSKPTRATVVNAVNGSKVFLSGSVVIRDQVPDCEHWSWSVVTQTRDSSNNLYYGPSDVSAFCDGPSEDPKGQTLLIVLPVEAIWVSVYGTEANFNDPSWKPLSEPSAGHECWSGQADDKDVAPLQGILPCDKEKEPPKPTQPGEAPTPTHPGERSPWLLRDVLYTPFVERLYTLGALPGVSQGSISIDPVALATKSTFDVQAYESLLQGPGWIGFQAVYEHDRKPQDDFNSLTAAITYDFRIKNAEPFWTPGCPGRCGGDDGYAPPLVGIRPAELIVRAGPEWSPDAFKPSTPKNGGPYASEYLPRDVNIVTGFTLRLPIIFSPVTGFAPRQPSQLSVTPAGGLEWGYRVNPHEVGLGTACPSTTMPCAQLPQYIFRGVAGVDASGRWPYSVTRNFLGDRPLTMDFSYRKRWLTKDEPFANEETIVNSVNSYNVPAEGQSTGGRTYTRITLIEPASAYFQLRVVWQRGSLPPSFQYVKNLVAIGVTFSNPGVSEH